MPDESPNDVRSTVAHVLRELDDVQPNWSTFSDLGEADDWARVQMQQRFAWLSPEALDDLRWVFTFGWK